MTVQTRFHNWGTYPDTSLQRCSPLLVTLRHYLMGRWGGQYLGCYSPRTIIGGRTLSSHASGAALDWRYQDPGAGRPVLLSTIIPWLLNNSEELGVDAVHDYIAQRVWRPPGTSGRSPGPVDSGWRSGNYQYGHWIHIEVLKSRWSDTRTIEQMLGSGPAPPPPPAPSPAPSPSPPTDIGDPDMPVIISRETTSDTIWVSPHCHARYGIPSLDALELLVIGGALDGAKGTRLQARGAGETWKHITAMSTTQLNKRLGKPG